MRAANRLDFPIPASVIEREIRELIVRGKDFEERFKFDRCYLRTVDRKNLDHFLFERAGKDGAETISGTEVESISEKDDHVKLNVGGKTIEARSAVIAEGATSRNARSVFGPYPKNYKAMGMRAVAETESPPEDIVEVDLIDSPTKHLERFPMVPMAGWVFPYKTRANYGICGYRYSRAELDNGLARVVQRSIAHPTEEIVADSHPIPIWPRPRFTTKRIVLIGDAAGFASPISGEGLSHGFQSSKIAAKALADLLEGKNDALRRYESEAQRTIVVDIKAAAFVSPVLHWLLGVVDTGEFFRVVREDNEYLQAWMRMAYGDERWQKLMSMTMARFPRLLFSSLSPRS